MTETIAISVPDLIAVLRRSALVNDERLKKALQGVDLQRVQAVDITQLLTEAKLLTPWQCRQLLKGRYKGYRLGKYLLLGELGRGGMAKVFLARHETLLNLVAIKVLARERLAKPSMIHRFLREARAAAQLNHPNIVRVCDVDVDDDRHYLVMEYVRGRSVQEMVDNDGPLSFERAARYTQQAALGLAAAHRHGLIHRDVKPANLLAEDDKLVKLSDFGLARDGGEGEGEGPSLTMQHDEKVLGTADYIAPEQAINSHAIDARADLYSLGYTLYFMLTGQPPFPTGRIVERLTKHCTQEPESVRSLRPDVPADLLAIVEKLTRKSADDRYASAEEAAAALGAWLAEPGRASVSSVSLPAPRSRPAAAPQPSSGVLGGDGSSLDHDLSLAPDDESERTRPARRAALKASGSDLAPDSAAAGKSPSQPVTSASLEPALLPQASDLGDLLDDLPPLSEGRSSDVHGSDVRTQSWEQARIETATSGAMPSRIERQQAQTASAAARFYAGMKRGEYPLWLLIGAGLILGLILILVAFSYTTSNQPIEMPDYKRLEN